MKVGDRVRIASDNHTAGLNAVGQVGTLLKEAPGDLHWSRGDRVWVVQTDEQTGGHDARGVGKPGHCWNVDERDLEEISMGEDKEDLKAVLKMRLKHVSGIGNAKAEKCASVVMEVLDEIVEDYRSGGDKTKTPVDFPWDKIPLKWKWAAWDFDAGNFELRVYREKPEITRLDDGRILWNGDDAPTPKIEDYPPHLKPSTPDEAKEWLFQRPE